MSEDSAVLRASMSAAQACYRDRRFQDAEVHYRRALAIDAAQGLARHQLARLCLMERRFQEAVTLLQQTARSPELAVEGHLLLALALEGLRRYEDAIAHYERLLTLEESADVLGNLGNLLLLVRRGKEALEVLSRAITLRPDLAVLHYHLGRTLIALGQLDEARRAFEQAVMLQPRNAGFHRALATTKRFGRSDPQLAALEALAAEVHTLDEDNQIELHFALGKACCDLGEDERAFEHLVRGNRLKRRRLIYDEDAALQTFEALKIEFSSGTMRQKASLGHPCATPVFIVGMPRSGSTLIEQILASHPGVFGAGEISTFGDLARRLFTAAPGLDFSEVVRRLTAEQLHRLGEEYCATLQALSPAATRIVDKLPANFMLVGLIHLALPKARLIHTVRDPLDTCLSCFAGHFEGAQAPFYDLGELGRHFRAYQSLMEHWHAVLPAGVLLDVQYEQVVEDLESQARRLVRHCGLEWDAACLRFNLNPRPVATASAAQVRQPIYRDSVGRARRYLHRLQPLVEALNGADRRPND